MQLDDPRLRSIRDQLPEEVWEARLQAARAEAALFDQALVEIEAGEAAKHVLGRLMPEKNAVHAVRRLRRYQREGVEGLIDRRFVKRASKMTPEVQAWVRGALAASPELRSERLVELVRETLGAEVPGSTIRQWLREQGLSHRTGPAPTGEGEPRRVVGAVALPNAGAELLKALDEQLGATAALTEAMTAALAELPEPTSAVRDDRPGRDGTGRFTAEVSSHSCRLPRRPCLSTTSAALPPLHDSTGSPRSCSTRTRCASSCCISPRSDARRRPVSSTTPR